MAQLTERIIEYVRAHPNVGSADIMQGLPDADPRKVSPTLSNLHRQGRLVRQEQRRTLSKTPVYIYTVSDKPWRPKRGRKTKARALATKTRVQATRARAPAVTLDLDDLANEFIAKIAGYFAEKFKVELLGKVGEFIHSLPAPPQAPEPVLLEAPPVQPAFLPEKETRVRLPKVAIIGLLPQQAGEIQAEFSECLDLVFWSNGPQSSLKPIAIGCEAVFLHTRHMSHTADETLKRMGANIVRVTGGVSNMRDALMNYFANRK